MSEQKSSAKDLDLEKKNKRKKRTKNAKRYYDDKDQKDEKDDGDASKKTETFTVDGADVSRRRLAKWKKRRMAKIDGGDPSRSKVAKQQKTAFEHGEEAGYVEFESDEEHDSRLSQTDIVDAVDVTSATKHFDLSLKDFGPYYIDYNRSGRHLVLGGKRGHMAAFDWQTKKLHCEFNALETVNSVKWLHQETLLAAAQRSGVYVYDNQGVEIHVLQQLDAVLRMEFLPYHMLLVTANEKGFLGYTDVSMGTRAASICTGLGRLDVMTHNPQNAVVLLGHAPGTVTMWTPTTKGPVMKMLCHKAPVSALAVDSTGNYVATSGVDRRLKVFDLRTCQPLSTTRLTMGASSLDFSQRGLLAAAMATRVQVYRDVCRQTSVVSPYLSHMCGGSVQQLQFCPFEDVLGVGHQRGFTSLIVPGSGEADIDAMEVNPYATKKQRQNAEVKLLLDKLQPEMIGLTNWVKDLSSKSRSRPPVSKQPVKKLGKKEKEQEVREKKRASVKTEDKQEYDPTDVLARFRKRTTENVAGLFVRKREREFATNNFNMCPWKQKNSDQVHPTYVCTGMVQEALLLI
ncbi:WD repeat-containing protein 46-like isoform X2 [Littorina saxatilis]|uniref:WD repeat-containing protein 46-like isoform X2 n=1 Tax=Littorina saxatilis TaxID=31220 RepID=UPI0038B59882